ncbi:Cysteine synthase B [hydrothermal vent metagenome]|uniref:Cysteine synthase B n=1 Tax=hydrothermal vent metagenome TaxID=652676 RepID=A0A3B1BR58_9ZZZZ
MSKLAPAAYFKPDEIDLGVLEGIGDTPLIELKNIAGDECPGVSIFAKAEWHNSGGSVKARPALRMIEQGEKSGELRPGMTILDSTSGNTGVAYALIGLVKGYKVKLVMPGNICNERKQLMASRYHAEVVYSDPIESSDGAILMVEQIYKTEPEAYFWPDQYNNDENWKAHYYTTANEIWEQTGHTVTHFLAGIGTTGTVMGTSRGLKAHNKKIMCYAVEPEESLHGIEGLKHMATSIVPGIYVQSELDGKIPVKTEKAYEMVNRLAEQENIMVGSSSGAAVAGAVELGKTLNEGVIVTVLPDSCECDIAHGDFLKDL